MSIHPKGVDKALKDVSKSQKKSTSTRAPVAEPSLFISKKAQDCDLPSLETEFNLDNEQAIVELTVLQPELPSSLVLSPQVFEEEPLDFPHQCPCLDTRICLDDDLGPIFDEEDEPDVGKDMPILKMNTVVAYLDKILVCNIYFDEHLERLKNVQFVLGKDILICDLNKYLSCTFDPGLLVFVLSIQERQVQPLNESIGRAQQPQIWRSFVVQTDYLGASNRGSVQEGYLNSPKVFCLESNFTRKPTHQGFTEAWKRMKSFTDEDVMNFPNRRFFSPSIREYQISKGDSCPRKNRPEPKPILHEPKVFPRSFSCLNQKHYLMWFL
ncbi:hypothetical protein YC2023_005377 [Brassica napus]